MHRRNTANTSAAIVMLLACFVGQAQALNIAEIEMNPLDNPTVDVFADSVCPGEPGMICAVITGGVGPYSVSWFDQTNGGAPVAVPPCLTAGGEMNPCCITVNDGHLYRAVATDAKGNTGEGTGGVSTHLPPEIAVSGASVCAGNFGSLCAIVQGENGPYSVMWFNVTAGNTPVPGSDCKTPGGVENPCCITVNNFDTYRAVATGDNGCSADATGSLTNAGSPAVNVADAAFGPGDPNAHLTAVVTGGSAPYTVTWQLASASADCAPTGAVLGTCTIPIGQSMCDFTPPTFPAPGTSIKYIATAEGADHCIGSDCGILSITSNTTGNGCTAKFWKHCSNDDQWMCPYCPGSHGNACPSGCVSCTSATRFCDVFHCPSGTASKTFADKSLLQVLRMNGSSYKDLGRETVAALLNAARYGSQYSPLYPNPQAVITKFNSLVDNNPTTTQINQLMNQFKALNQQVCPSENGGADAKDNEFAEASDMDGNGQVDQADFEYLLSKWRTGDDMADIDRDGVVGPNDLAILLGWWGR